MSDREATQAIHALRPNRRDRARSIKLTDPATVAKLNTIWSPRHAEPKAHLTPTWSAQRDGLRLLVWRDPWPRPQYRYFYAHRDIRFAVLDVANNLLAGGHFTEWTWGLDQDDYEAGLPTLDGFVDYCDGFSQNAYNTATAIRHGWKDDFETPLNYGNIVLFDRLQIERAATAYSATIWQFIADLIAREYPPRGRQSQQTSIIVLKAFPLAYEGEVTDSNNAAFERRQRALIRHYQRRLSAQEFDGGTPGWMWIEINCPLKPSAKRRRRKRT
jgi:hypothetical protein